MSLIGQIILYLVNLIIIVVILDIILHKPITKYLEKRNNKIKTDLEQAEESRLKAEALQVELDEKLNQLNATMQAQITAANDQAVLESKQIIDRARSEAEEIIMQARAQLKTERAEAISQMQQELTHVALELAEKILEREVNDQDNQHIIDGFFQEVI